VASSKLLVAGPPTQDVDMSAAEDRKPLELTDRDWEELEPFRSPGPERAALSFVAGTALEGDVPETELQRAVFRVGLSEVLSVARLCTANVAARDQSLRTWVAYMTHWRHEPSGWHLHTASLSQPDLTAEHAARLVEEGLRMEAHPGIIFKDGHAGRRPAIADGPDVWEVIKFIRGVEERGSAALEAAAEMLNLDPRQVNAAVSYYGDYKEEIDDWITRAERASERAEKAWLAKQELIS
jgi:hypothetical protein